MRGVVKFFNCQRGFGFVALKDGTEVYFNRAGLRRDRPYDPVEGDQVECEVRDGKQGKIAFRIEQEVTA